MLLAPFLLLAPRANVSFYSRRVKKSDAAVSTRVRPYRYSGSTLHLLDQRRLPHERSWLSCRTAEETAEAIRSLAVRGAPLIGVAAALGLAAHARSLLASAGSSLDGGVLAGIALIGQARPTAVNLPWAMARMKSVWESSQGLPGPARVEALESEALTLASEDEAACSAIGENGADFLEALLGDRPSPWSVLTHCNAGALATAGIGTALGVIRALAARRDVAVYADETRPFWQGARLTAWELLEDGLSVTVVPDVAAASLIGGGRITAVIVGADRIAANGDTANKVGTYPVALACHRHEIPFLVAAPVSTLDLRTPSGREIPIEFRESSEVLFVDAPGAGRIAIAPDGAKAVYPAFDVTPNDLITGIVTERGVARPPFARDLGLFSGGR
ncbi:MAG: Methylthioribose-1-phosphate isomerase [Thermoanaerobaculia bacterium]|nr:Methylthioribose-1-phosphate isomerase [Thermoanaerobaculia bacterium]